jgi:hypothetical protein
MTLVKWIPFVESRADLERTISAVRGAESHALGGLNRRGESGGFDRRGQRRASQRPRADDAILFLAGNHVDDAGAWAVLSSCVRCAWR